MMMVWPDSDWIAPRPNVNRERFDVGKWCVPPHVPLGFNVIANEWCRCTAIHAHGKVCDNTCPCRTDADRK